MGQAEILIYLYNEYQKDIDKYFSVTQICKGLGGCPNPTSVRRQLLQLTMFDFIEVVTVSKWGFFSEGEAWKRGFRLREKSISKVEAMIKAENTGIEVNT